MNRFLQRANAPIDIALIVYFRIVFGIVLAWQMFRSLRNGWAYDDFVAPGMHFNFYPFTFVEPLPGVLPIVHVFVLLVLAYAVALGWRYRATSVLFAFGYTWLFLSEQSTYLNHGYLVCLLAWILAVLPCHRALSLDVQQGRVERADEVPAWTVWLLRAQFAFVYVYGGIAKINADWLQAQPLTIWMADAADTPLIGSFVAGPWGPWFLAYGGLVFDLLIVPAVVYRRTRVGALVAALAFHTTNKLLFSIGIFPYIAMAGTLLFLEADWPRRFARWALHQRDRFLPRKEQPRAAAPDIPAPGALRSVYTGHAWAGPVFLVLWCAWQALVPLRHFCLPSDPHWSEIGHNFSWHMMLRSKLSDVRIDVIDKATGEPVAESLTARYATLVNDRQARKLSIRPDMIVQYAQHLAAEERKAGRDVEVRATVFCSLNGRPPQLLLDPTADLAKAKRGVALAEIIRPLTQPLPHNPLPWRQPKRIAHGGIE